jgi:glycosyltransferase involved in cell wall biosynthesis
VPPDNSIKICFVTYDYPPKGGGLAVAARRVVGFLVEEGWTVHVVTAVAADELPAQRTSAVSVEQGATIHRVASEITRPDSTFHFRQFIRDLEGQVCFDLFHGFFISAVPLCVATAQLRPPGRRAPVIASIRGGDVNVLTLNPFFLSEYTRSLKKAAWVTSVNQTYLDQVGRYVELTGKSGVIRNSVLSTSESWRLDAAERGAVGTAGQFRSEKDIPLLIRAYQHVSPEVRRSLTLVGAFADSREQEWSETLIEEFGLGGQTHVTGHLPHSEVASRLRRLNVYVHSSSREGMPNALLEAAAVGLPLVATTADGIREILTDGADALLVPHGYPQLLGAAIERVLSQPDLAIRLSHTSKQLAARYNVENERRQWVDLYRRLLRDSALSESA